MGSERDVAHSPTFSLTHSLTHLLTADPLLRIPLRNAFPTGYGARKGRVSSFGQSTW